MFFLQLLFFRLFFWRVVEGGGVLCVAFVLKHRSFFAHMLQIYFLFFVFCSMSGPRACSGTSDGAL